MNNRRLLQAALGVVAIIAGAQIAGRYQRDLRHARERYAVLRQRAATRSGPVEYATVGSGPALLLVHGAGGGYDQGLDFGLPFAASGFRLIAMSRFGYLGTPLPDDASAEAQADAHAHLLDTLGVREAAIIGASAGAPSAMQFALRHPDRCTALVLVVPAAYVPRPRGGPSMLAPASTGVIFDTALHSDLLYWAATRLARRAMVRGLLATPPELLDIVDADERARAAEMLQHVLPVSARRRGLINDARVTSSLTRYDLESITSPTLVISVADDLFGTYDAARYTAQHIRGARFVGLRSGGHVWLGHHRQQIAEIIAFLRGTAGNRPAG